MVKKEYRLMKESYDFYLNSIDNDIVLFAYPLKSVIIWGKISGGKFFKLKLIDFIDINQKIVKIEGKTYNLILEGF